MKKLVIWAAVAAVSSASAFAADLPTQTYKSAPVVAQIYNWTGVYVGVNGGYGWGTQDPLVLFSNRFDRSSFNINGGMFGGTMGAQIQQGYVVLGLEGDLDWANIKGTGISTPTIGGLGLINPITLNIASNISAVGTVRARVGVAMNNWLFYGTGGAAFVKSSANGTSIAGVPCGTPGVFPNCAASAWRPGLLGEDGVVLGQLHRQYLRHDGPEHVLCFAPTRSGKGVGLVVPTLLTWPASCIIHDIKGENWHLTAGWRARFGRVLLFDPTNPGSSAYNPLLEVRRGDREIRDVQNVADILVDPEGALERRNHWEKTSHSLLVGAILHVLYAEHDKTLAGVANFLSDPKRPIETTLRAMMTTPHHGDHPHPVVASAARELLNKSENERWKRQERPLQSVILPSAICRSPKSRGCWDIARSALSPTRSSVGPV